MRGKLFTVTLLVVGIALMGGCKRSAPTGGAPTEGMTIPTLDEATLGHYKGKVVLMNFWATWCEPCKKEIPWLIKANEAYGSRGLVILGVSMDDEGEKVVLPFVQQRYFDVDGKSEQMNYPILLGNEAISEKFGGLLGLPTSMLYGRDGQKLQTIVGAVSSYDDLTKALDKAL